MSEKEMAVFRSKAKTFSLAARLFPSDLRVGAAQVYSWCRYADDVVDEGTGDVEELRFKTLQIWRDPSSVSEGPYLALRSAVQRFNIPRDYPLELIEGMEMDSEGRRYETFKDLELYCYHVASTVGLMMCHLMGLYDTKALGEAVALGKAMQLTNIARDVKEDFLKGRVYIPQQWLREETLDTSAPWPLLDRAKLFRLTSRLISESESLYEKGLTGVIHLPFRPAIAVMVAGLLYREIGRQILLRGELALEERVVVSPSRKACLTLKAIWTVLMSLPARLRRRKRIKLDVIWRAS